MIVSGLVALLSAGVYGAADFLGGFATRRAGTLAVCLWSQLAGAIVLVAVAFAIGGSPTRTELVWGGLAGLAGGVGVALLYRALAIGPASVAAPITAAIAIAVPVVVAALLGERVGPLAGIGIAMAVVAVVLVSRSAPAADGAVPGQLRRVVTLAIASGIAVGFFFVCLSRSTPAAGQWPLVAARAVSMSAFVIAALASRTKLALPRPAWGITVAAGLLDTLANALYLIAVRGGSLAIVSTLASLYPVSTVLLARGVLGERLHREQTAGLALAALAVILIGLGARS